MSRLQLAAAKCAAELRELAAEYRRQGRTADAERTERHAELYARFANADR